MIGDVNLFLNDANDPTVAEIEVIRSQMHCKHMQLVFRKEKQNYIFWCQFNVKPSIVPDCPGSWSLPNQKTRSLELCSQELNKVRIVVVCTDHDCCESQPA